MKCLHNLNSSNIIDEINATINVSNFEKYRKVILEFLNIFDERDRKILKRNKVCQFARDFFNVDCSNLIINKIFISLP